MNKVAIIADVHGNFEALEAVLSSIKSKGIAKIINLGDTIDYGPDSVKCLRRTSEVCNINLIGNHEGAILGLCRPSFTPHGYTSYKILTHSLGPRHVDLLKDRKPFAFYSSEFINCYMMHGSIDDYFWGKFDFNRAIEVIKMSEEDKKMNLFLSAHSHVGIIEQSDNVMHINPGSVGQPRDGISEASYAILNYSNESTSVMAELVRVPYDFKTTQVKMSVLHLPKYLIDRLALGK